MGNKFVKSFFQIVLAKERIGVKSLMPLVQALSLSWLLKEETMDEIFQGLSFSLFFLTITQITSYFFTVSRREDYVVFVRLFSKQVLVQQLNWVISCLPSPSRREHVSMQWFSRPAYMERELTRELEQAWCSCPTVPGRPKLVCANGMALCRLVCWETKCKPALPEQAKK